MRNMLKFCRYSLSDMSISHSGIEREKPRASPVQNTSGPLLASTRFQNNVGYVRLTCVLFVNDNGRFCCCFYRTYMDSKSPGLASRIVQYSRDAEHKPTHQAKYGRPGVFPVVHLFNKEKTTSPKPKTVTLRFAPSGEIFPG